jgi:hypothetical protein
MIPFLNEIGRNIIYRYATSYYTVEVKAQGKSGGVRSLQAVVKVDSRQKEGYKIVQWVDAVF